MGGVFGEVAHLVRVASEVVEFDARAFAVGALVGSLPLRIGALCDEPRLRRACIVVGDRGAGLLGEFLTVGGFAESRR